MIYVITDTHLGHDRMQFHCARPPDFNERIIKNVLTVANNCTHNDIFIHLGDVAWCNYSDWHEYLTTCMVPAKKWLVIGNHEKHSINWYMAHGWDFAADAIRINMFSKRILFTHEPEADIGHFDINVHGHLHNTGHHNAKVTDKHRLYHIEDNFMPIKLETLINGITNND